jgi:hypothetical protein
MKRCILVALSVVALCALAPPRAYAQAGKAKPAQTKGMSASGTVKSVSGTSLVITDKSGKDMTFTVDSSTKFVGKGLGTKSAKGPITATDAVAANDQVSVTYHDMGGTMHAASVRVMAKGKKN